MTSDAEVTDNLHPDNLHVVCSRAPGIDVHKMQITATVRICEARRNPARAGLRQFRRRKPKPSGRTSSVATQRAQACGSVSALPPSPF